LKAIITRAKTCDDEVGSKSGGTSHSERGGLDGEGRGRRAVGQGRRRGFGVGESAGEKGSGGFGRV